MNEMTPSVFLRKIGRGKQKETALCPDVSHFGGLDFKMDTDPHFIVYRRSPRPDNERKESQKKSTKSNEMRQE
jgi:hypothetical protein